VPPLLTPKKYMLLPDVGSLLTVRLVIEPIEVTAAIRDREETRKAGVSSNMRMRAKTYPRRNFCSIMARNVPVT
jgi:hypothetical protein